MHTIIAIHIGASMKVQSSLLCTPDEDSACIYLSLRIEVLTQRGDFLLGLMEGSACMHAGMGYSIAENISTKHMQEGVPFHCL